MIETGLGRRLVLAMFAWSAMAAPAVCAEPVMMTLPVGQPVVLETVSPLSSKSSVKGDLIDLRTVRDVVSDGRIAIPAGTMAKGQIAEARAKGGLGVSGRLFVRPLYVAVAGQFVRLKGQTSGKGSLSAGGVMGLVILTPAFSGRSAVIPAGTEIMAEVEKTATLSLPAP